MRMLDHDVLDAAAFLGAVLRACPNGSELELIELSGSRLSDALAASPANQVAGMFRSGQRQYRIDGDSRGAITAEVERLADDLIITWLALRGPEDGSTWFEAPHFGEWGKRIVFMHDGFSSPLADRLRESGVIREIDPSEDCADS
jgi:hypothetical protein